MTTIMRPAGARQDCWNHVGVHGDKSCPELVQFTHCRNCPIFTASGRSLLDRTTPSEYQQDWTLLLAGEKAAISKGSLSLFVFRLETEWMALPAKLFIEISDLKKWRRVPSRTNPVFKGLVNIRGELQLCVSLHQLLEIPEPAPEQEPRRRLAVVEKERVRWVFLMDQVQGLIRCVPDDIRKPPSTVAKAASPHVKGVLTWEDKQVGCLDEELIFYQLTRSTQ